MEMLLNPLQLQLLLNPLQLQLQLQHQLQLQLPPELQLQLKVQSQLQLLKLKVRGGFMPKLMKLVDIYCLFHHSVSEKYFGSQHVALRV